MEVIKAANLNIVPQLPDIHDGQASVLIHCIQRQYSEKARTVMTWIRNHLCLIWMVCVMCIFVQADIGELRKKLHNQLYWCQNKSSSLLSGIAQLLSCLTSSVFRCLLFHEPNARHQEVTELCCGVINSGHQIKPNTWHIAVHNQYGLYIDFLHFHLPNSPRCMSVATVSIKSVSTLLSEQSMHTYCGHRMPWFISFPHSQAKVLCSDEYNTPRGFHFVMTFQAFDSKLPSVSLVQLTEHELYLEAFTFASLAIGQALSSDETEIQLHIVIMPYNKIVIYIFSLSAFSLLKIYDGPGSLSPQIPTRESWVELSSYQGFLKYTTRIHDNITDAYTFAQTVSIIDPLLLNWTGNFQYYKEDEFFKDYSELFNNSRKCLYSTVHQLQGTSGRCWLFNRIDSITVHQMTFTGVNMLRHGPSSISSSCQYGGLFVYLVNAFSNVNDHSLNYVTLCTNVSDKIIFPLNNTDHLDDHNDEKKDYFIVIFITFEGYSNGYIDLTFGEDQECFGSNIIISRGLYGSKILSHWDDFSVSDGSILDNIDNLNLKERTTIMCRDVWLLNEIDIFESLPFQNYTFTLDHALLGFPVASCNMTIYGYYIHQTYFSVDSNAKSSLEIAVEINTSKQISATSEMVKFNFTVPPFVQSEHILDSPDYTTFKLKLLGYDKFPTFAIRVQFVENLICSPHERLTTFQNMLVNSVAKHVIYRIEGNISDVYLSPRHPYDELLSSIYSSAGYNGGTCRAIVKGHKCSYLKSHYQIIKIHYLPHKTLVTPQEIDISMKKTTNCSTECSLDIGILEYMQTVSFRKTRYHEWRKVYRMTWQIITAKARGYIVTINSTCASCTQLCDIALALGLPLTSNKVIPGTNNIYGKYLDLIRIIGDIKMYT